MADWINNSKTEQFNIGGTYENVKKQKQNKNVKYVKTNINKQNNFL